MQKFSNLLIIILMLPLSACFTQSPAPVEHKGKHIFKKNNSNMETSYSYENDGVIDLDTGSEDITLNEKVKTLDTDEIKVTPLKTVDEKNTEYLKAQDLTTEFKETRTTVETSQFKETKEVAGVNAGYLLSTPLGLAQFQWPLEGKIIQRYGKNGNKFNEGINIAAPVGTTVGAAGDGKVIYIGNNIEGYGNLLIIKHDNNYMTAYSHLNEISVTKDSAVKKGDNIGSVGQSGSASQSQLQFTMRKGKKTIDPEKVDN